MMTANDVRDARFSKAVGGYKQEEVDNFLDSVEADYRQYEAYVTSMQERVNALNSEIDGYKNSQSSLQNVLISAQQLADNIVNDAKAKAAQIIEDAKSTAASATAEAKEMLSNLDAKFAEKKALAEKDIMADLAKAKKEQEAVKIITQECVDRQQALFDKIRLEVAAFKNDLTEQYKKHIELISKMPDCIAMDAVRAAKAVELEIEKNPEVELSAENETAEAIQETEEVEPIVDIEATEETEPEVYGFAINTEAIEEEADENADEEAGFSNSFFGKNK